MIQINHHIPIYGVKPYMEILMALVTLNAGELLLLEWMLKSTSTPENLTLKLYKNDYTPVAGSVAADFTEADFTSYTSKSLSRGSWVAPSTVSGKASTSYASQSWSVGTTGNTLYGYYIVGATSGTAIWAERFPAPKVVTDGDTVQVVPTFTGDSES